MLIGDRIRARRKELGLTVDEVAALLNKDRSTVYRYEAEDIENMPYTVLTPLAKILKTTPAYLMGWEEEKETPILDERLWNAIRDNKDLYHFVLGVMELPEDEQEKLISTGLFLPEQVKK